MRDGSVHEIETSVRGLLARRNRLVLAVSGGVDSAVMLDAIARLRGPSHRVVVATRRSRNRARPRRNRPRVSWPTAAQFGLPAISERLFTARADEASWRAGRWEFLRTRRRGRRSTRRHRSHAERPHRNRGDAADARGERSWPGGTARASRTSSVRCWRTTAQRFLRTRNTTRFRSPKTRPTNRAPSSATESALTCSRRFVGVRPGFEREIVRVSRQAADVRAKVDALVDDYILESAGEASLLVLDAAAPDELPG